MISSGDTDQDACSVSPAVNPKAFAVAGSTKADAREGDSNFGSCVDLFAPAEDILAADIGSASATQTRSGTGTRS